MIKLPEAMEPGETGIKELGAGRGFNALMDALEFSYVVGRVRKPAEDWYDPKSVVGKFLQPVDQRLAELGYRLEHVGNIKVPAKINGSTIATNIVFGTYTKRGGRFTWHEVTVYAGIARDMPLYDQNGESHQLDLHFELVRVLKYGTYKPRISIPMLTPADIWNTKDVTYNPSVVLRPNENAPQVSFPVDNLIDRLRLKWISLLKNP